MDTPSYFFHLTGIYFPSFYFWEMLFLNVKSCFLNEAEEWILFMDLISHSVILLGNWYHWCWELSLNSDGLFTLFCSCTLLWVTPFLNLFFWYYLLFVFSIVLLAFLKLKFFLVLLQSCVCRQLWLKYDFYHKMAFSIYCNWNIC